MSSASPKTQEPSMEEILASIRRIIADDQEGAKTPEPAPRPAAVRPVAPPPPPEPEDDDILDLAGVAAPVPPPAPRPKLDLEHEDVSFRDQDTNQIDFDALDVGDDEPEPVVEPEPVAPPPPPAAPAFARIAEPSPEPERLITGATDAAVGQAFNMLAHTVLTGNARTLEDLVKEMLRPMLKNWLDDNLPTLVERLVRAEIERVARGGR